MADESNEESENMHDASLDSPILLKTTSSSLSSSLFLCSIKYLMIALNFSDLFLFRTDGTDSGQYTYSV